MKDFESIAKEAALACGKDEDYIKASMCAALSLVIARCHCGWFDYFPSFSESPSTCPRCSKDLVIRNSTDMDEIIYPATTPN